MVEIARVSQELMRDGQKKYVVSFVGKHKGLVLNVTNGKRLAAAFGKNTDAWIGKEIELFPQRGQTGGFLPRPSQKKLFPDSMQNSAQSFRRIELFF